MVREYFCAYHSYRAWMKTLSDAEKGRLFDALLAYSETGEQLPLSGKEAALFPAMQWNIDREKEKYKEICIRNSCNGKSGGRPKNPVGFQETKKSQGKGESEDKEKTPTESKRKFSPPSLEEVREYCRQRKNTVKPEAFVDFYTSKGWMVGKTPMKDWKAAVRNWEHHEKPAAEPEKEDPYANVII